MNRYSITYINLIAGGSYFYEIDGINAICVQQGGTGGHTYNIDALNELCTLIGAPANHYYNINALNAIITKLGGVPQEYENKAWAQIASIGFLPEIFRSVTAAWSLSESGMRREVKGSGIDFYPVRVTNGTGTTAFAGTDQYMVCGDGAYSLDADTPFTVSFTINPTASGGGIARWILTKGFYTGTASEYYCYHVAGRLYVRVADGTTQVTVSDGDNFLPLNTSTKVTFGYDNVNHIISVKIGENTPVTAAYNQPTQHSGGGLTLGLSATQDTAGNGFIGELSNLMIWKGTYLTAEQQAELHASEFPFTTLPAQAVTLDPDTVADGYSRIDLSDTSNLFTDVAKTTAVAADADPVRVAVDLWGGSDWVAPTDASRPLYKENILNSLGVGLWNGTDSEMAFANMPGTGDFTMIFIAQNSRNNQAKGSQIFKNSDMESNYISITGTDYGGGSYAVIHTNGNGAPAVATLAPIANPTGFNLIEISRSGSNYKILQNGFIWYDYLLPLVGDNRVNNCGREYASGWWFNGYMAECMFFTRTLSDAERARIRAYLIEKWNVQNVTFMQG